MTDWEEVEKGYYPKMFIVNLLGFFCFFFFLFVFLQKANETFLISMTCILKHASITILQRVVFS